LAPNPLAIVPYAPPLFITLIDKLGDLDNQLSDPKPADVAVNMETDKDLSTKRRLDFGSKSDLQDVLPAPPLLASTPTKKVAKRPKETPASEMSVRRSTRKSMKKDGYKLEPMRDKVTPKKKPKSAKARVPKSDASVPPPTPVAIIGKVGENLEIPAEEMSMEKLMADPVQSFQMNKQDHGVYFGTILCTWPPFLMVALLILYYHVNLCGTFHYVCSMCKTFYYINLSHVMYDVMVHDGFGWPIMGRHVYKLPYLLFSNCFYG
jgi:hypothetical protein